MDNLNLSIKDKTAKFMPPTCPLFGGFTVVQCSFLTPLPIMEVVEGDQECHQERENQEKDGKSGGYGVLTTEILYKVVLTLSAQATF